METVRNAALPSIGIYCGDADSAPLAASVGYGIEEEGLPYQIVMEQISPAEAYELTRRAGLGVVVLVAEGQIAVFTRQLKQQKPIFDSGDGAAVGSGAKGMDATAARARIMGKNAARIVKNKPFLEGGI